MEFFIGKTLSTSSIEGQSMQETTDPFSNSALAMFVTPNKPSNGYNGNQGYNNNRGRGGRNSFSRGRGGRSPNFNTPSFNASNFNASQMDFAYQGKNPTTKLAAMASASNIQHTQSAETWLTDSGASDHILASSNNLHPQAPYHGQEQVSVGNGQKVSIQTIVQDLPTGRVLYKDLSRNGVYPIHSSNLFNFAYNKTACAAHSVSHHKWQLWHSRLGHPSNKVLSSMFPSLQLFARKILSAPQQLGPQAETLKQGGYFSYNTQLPDRQELLRSSRNLVATLAHRVFLTHNKLIRKPGYVEKRTHSKHNVELSDRPRFSPGLAGISDRKNGPPNGPKTLRWSSVRGTISHEPKLGFRKFKTLRERVAQAFQRYQERRNPTSGARSNMRANCRQKKSSRLTMKLIREPGCIRKDGNDSSYDVQLSGSPVASPVWLESSPEKHEKIAPAPRLPGAITLLKASKTAPENRARKGYERENRGGFGGGAAWRIRLPRGGCRNSRGMVTRRAPWSRARRAAPPIKRATPPLISTQILLGSRPL
uniref:GAG-pre-integrase domain-containing protein n=1 Tax=Fagus sylvatica TaxID=28930 RepID=A0A2N9EYV7_FAGSY